MEIASKVFVVTGGGDGIGRQLTLLLLQRGASVAAVDISEDALIETKKLAGEYASRLSTHICDLADVETVKKLVPATIDAHGTVDGIINNAGIIQQFVPFQNLDYESIKRVIDVNLWGVLNVTTSFMPVLLDRPEGYIVNISSMGGFFPFPKQTIYGATKAAIKLLSEGMAADLYPTNVGVSVVFPGAINTNIMQNSGVAMDENLQGKQDSFKGTSPQKVASLVLGAIEKNKLYVYAGTDSKIMNILYRIRPTFATKIVHALMRRIMPD